MASPLPEFYAHAITIEIFLPYRWEQLSLPLMHTQLKRFWPKKKSHTLMIRALKD